MNPAPLARPVLEQLAITYPNRERPVRPSCYEIDHLQTFTHDHWFPAPWFTPMAVTEQAARPAAA